jgi:hypothetical protein
VNHRVGAGDVGVGFSQGCSEVDDAFADSGTAAAYAVQFVAYELHGWTPWDLI